MILQERIDRLQAELNALKKEVDDMGVFPKFNDDYWTYDSDYNITDYTWKDDDADEIALKAGAVFRTEVEGLNDKARMIAYRKLWAIADGGSWYITRTDTKYISILYGHSLGIPSFSSQEVALAAIKEIGENVLGAIYGGNSR